MRYIFLIYAGEDARWDVAPDESKRVMDLYRTFSGETRMAGVFVSGHELQPSLTATTVRAPRGKPLLTDGSAVQTPLALSGYYVLDVADERDALRWAAKIPGARVGAVEVRPIV